MLSIAFMLPLAMLTGYTGSTKISSNNPEVLSLQPDPKQSAGKMRSIVFKSQDYCRLELKDFEFDAVFSVMSATVYFTGTNFKTVERGYITSNSLKPIKHLMDRCQPGTIVIFDDVKIKAPGNETRIIDGVTYQLY
jgi:hypothetical protein